MIPGVPVVVRRVDGLEDDGNGHVAVGLQSGIKQRAEVVGMAGERGLGRVMDGVEVEPMSPR